MDKSKAHIVLFIFDLAAFFGCYHVYGQWASVSVKLAQSADTISIQKPMGLYLLLLMIPFLHVSSLIKPGASLKKWLNYSLIIILGVIFLLGQRIDAGLDENIINAGYTFCPQQSETMHISQFKTYLKDPQRCQ